MPLPTCLAADLVGAEVLAVVEEVAAQRGADASAVSTQELVLLARGSGRRGLCGHTATVTTHPEESTDFMKTVRDPNAYGSSAHPTCRRSSRRRRTSSTLADTRGRFGTGKLW